MFLNGFNRFLRKQFPNFSNPGGYGKLARVQAAGLFFRGWMCAAISLTGSFSDTSACVLSTIQKVECLLEPLLITTHLTGQLISGEAS